MPEDTSGPVRAKRTRLDPGARESAIVEGAVRYFSEVGFDGSMRDLAARLGISHALLFRYFPTKEALVDRVYDRIYVSRWDAAWDGLLKDRSTDLAPRLTRFYTAYLAAIDRPDWVRTFIYGGLAGVGINRRYLRLIERKVIVPIALEVERLAGRRAAAAPTAAALEASWGLHGEIFYLPMRRWVYGLEIETDVGAFVRLAVDKFLLGAPAALKRTPRARA